MLAMDDDETKLPPSDAIYNDHFDATSHVVFARAVVFAWRYSDRCLGIPTGRAFYMIEDALGTILGRIMEGGERYGIEQEPEVAAAS